MTHAGADAAGVRRSGRACHRPALRAEGEADHLPVHGGRAVADRPLRSQAEAAAVRRAAHPRGHRQGRTLCVHQGHASPARIAVHFQQARALGGGDLRRILPHLAKHADEIAIVRSMTTTQFNHAPGQIFMNTGHQIIGRPSLGSWLSYGLGSENTDLPAFVVLMSGQNNPDGGKIVLGQRVSADPAPGRGVPIQGRAGALLENPDGVDSDGATRVARPRGRSEPRAARRDERPGDGDAHCGLRARLPHADQRARADGRRGRAAADPRDVRHRAGQGVVREQLPAGAPPGRARRAVRAALSPRLGHARRVGGHRHRRAAAAAVPRDRSRGRRAADRPETARPARHDARASGAASSAARRSTRRGTARSCSAATTIRAPSRCGWPAAGSSRA